MKWRLLAVTFLGLLAHPAQAHRIDEYLQATIISLERNEVHASMRLIPGVMVAPSVIAGIDTNHDGAFSDSEKRAYADRVLGDLAVTINGQRVMPQLDTWSLPEASQLRDGLGEILIQYHLHLPASKDTERSLLLVNHHLNAGSVYLVNAEVPQDPSIHILSQKRNAQQSAYELDYKLLGTGGVRSGQQSGLQAWAASLQFSSLFRLGMSHIREGTDHLLFLLVLLLPAPLLAAGGCWNHVASVRHSLRHIVGIVTAFTLGHSVTLSLAAMNLVHVPSRPVEVLIAVSILVSAIHALRPIFPGREAWIAAFFGLIHGLAFATTLERLGLSRWNRIGGILAFNLGIETMQLFVVALILPSLLLMSRTRAYPIVRIGGALLACAASLAWIGERLCNVQTLVDVAAEVVTKRGLWIALVFFTISLACWLDSESALRIGGGATGFRTRRSTELGTPNQRF